jgi:hypothetical protein
MWQSGEIPQQTMHIIEMKTEKAETRFKKEGLTRRIFCDLLL